MVPKKLIPKLFLLRKCHLKCCGLKVFPVLAAEAAHALHTNEASAVVAFTTQPKEIVTLA